MLTSQWKPNRHFPFLPLTASTVAVLPACPTGRIPTSLLPPPPSSGAHRRAPVRHPPPTSRSLPSSSAVSSTSIPSPTAAAHPPRLHRRRPTRRRRRSIPGAAATLSRGLGPLRRCPEAWGRSSPRRRLDLHRCLSLKIWYCIHDAQELKIWYGIHFFVQDLDHEYETLEQGYNCMLKANENLGKELLSLKENYEIMMEKNAKLEEQMVDMSSCFQLGLSFWWYSRI